jgi:hypothetical protein
MIMKHPFLRRAVLFSAAFTAAATTQAQTGFVYHDRDLVLGFRQPGGSSASDLVVNLGQASTYYSLAPGANLTISNYTLANLSGAFPGGLDGLFWSVGGDVHDSTSDTNYPLYTMWVTRPRATLNVKSTPWTPKSQFQQGPTCAKVSGIGNDAVTYGGTVPAGANNSSSQISIPPTSTYSYTALIGANGNYSGTFQGNAEQTTPFGFAGGGVAVQADLYQLKPSAGSSTFVGYFELETDGSMKFFAAPAANSVPQPTITGIIQSGGINTISFTSVTNGNYSLLATNQAGLGTPRSTWPVVNGPVLGNGGIKSLTDSSTDPIRYYSIKAVPAP